MTFRVKCAVVLWLGACGALWARGKDKLEPAQLVTYVKPVAPASADPDVLHSVGFSATLGTDGKLHDLNPGYPKDEYMPAAKAAASQWVYVPYKRKGKPIDKHVYLNVLFGPKEHVGDPGRPVRLSGGVMAPLIESKGRPPRSPRGMSGSVVLMGTIGKNGSVESVQAMSGPEELRERAVKAVSSWRYAPYLVDGVPVEIETTMTVNFSR